MKIILLLVAYLWVPCWLFGGDIELEIDEFNTLARTLYGNNDIDAAIRVSQKAYHMADSIGYLNGMSKSGIFLGILFTTVNRFTEAEQYFLQTIDVRRKMGYEAGIAYIYDNLCWMKKEAGDYLEAIKYGFLGLDLLKTLGKEKEEPTLFLNLAIAHQFNRDTADALNYYQEALEVAAALPDSVNLCRIYYNLGNFHRELINFDSAKTYLEKALGYAKEVHYSLIEAAVYDVLAVISTEEENYEKALSLFSQSIAINQELDDKLRLFHNYLYISKLYSKHGDFRTALLYCDTASQKLLMTQRKEEKELLNREYSVVYAGLNDFSKAYEYLNTAEGIKDSIFDEEKNRSIFKLQKNIAEKEKVEAENKFHVKERENERLIGGISFLALFSAFGLYFLNQRRLKNKKDLEDYKAEQDRIIDRRIFEEDIRVRKEFSTNLHNHVSTPLTHVKRFIEPIYQQFSFDKKVQTSLMQAMQIIDRTHVISRDIAYKLKPEKIDWVERIKLSLNALERKEDINADFQVSNLDEKHFNRHKGEQISSVICNLLSNADRHSEATKVEVRIDQDKHFLKLLVQDNGKGFDPAKTRGIGLGYAYATVNEMKGTIDIRSGVNLGTTINIKVPVDHE
ncbi:MAG: tetratricopeptide repeat protein [Saprospiraceae bacterium]|nr:tetratricopeptide repeat protein [Lewinella sp.]